MKLSNHYLNIAEKLFDDYDASFPFRPAICPNLFLNSAMGIKSVNAFRNAFQPKNKSRWDRFYDNFISSPTIEYHNKVRDHRVFSLLIMHELAKDYETMLESI